MGQPNHNTELQAFTSTCGMQSLAFSCPKTGPKAALLLFQFLGKSVHCSKFINRAILDFAHSSQGHTNLWRNIFPGQAIEVTKTKHLSLPFFKK